MAGFYDPKNKQLVHCDGEKEEFYCGTELDELSLALIKYKKGFLNTQQIYSSVLKLILENKLSSSSDSTIVDSSDVRKEVAEDKEKEKELIGKIIRSILKTYRSVSDELELTPFLVKEVIKSILRPYFQKGEIANIPDITYQDNTYYTMIVCIKPSHTKYELSVSEDFRVIYKRL